MKAKLAIPRAYTEESHGVYARGIYSAQECAAIVTQARALDAWREAEITVEDDTGQPENVHDASTRNARILDNETGAALLDEFEKRAREALPMIQEIWGIELRELTGTQLVHYLPGGHYCAHQDGGQSFGNRYFTILCYLNADFEGGQTSFPTLPYATRPEAGKMVIFPSMYYHCAEPVTRGEKFVLVTWACGPVPVRWI